MSLEDAINAPHILNRGGNIEAEIGNYPFSDITRMVRKKHLFFFWWRKICWLMEG